jgi:hypothetical protein
MGHHRFGVILCVFECELKVCIKESVRDYLNIVTVREGSGHCGTEDEVIPVIPFTFLTSKHLHVAKVFVSLTFIIKVLKLLLSKKLSNIY